MSRVLALLVELAAGMALGYFTASGSLAGTWIASIACGILLVLLMGPSEVDPIRRGVSQQLGRLPLPLVAAAAVLLLWSLGEATGSLPLLFMGGWVLGALVGLPGAGSFGHEET